MKGCDIMKKGKCCKNTKHCEVSLDKKLIISIVSACMAVAAAAAAIIVFRNEITELISTIMDKLEDRRIAKGICDDDYSDYADI